MKKTSILPEVVLDLSATNKVDAIAELAQVLLVSGKIKDTTAYITDIMQRENTMSTYCGYGVAIPHSVSPVVHEASFAFGRSTGLDWDEDDEQVQFVMLLAIPEVKDKEDSMHIEMMSAIATLALDDEVRAIWMQATSEDQIINTFAT